MGYMNKALSTTALLDSAFRRLVVEGLGDAAAYQKSLDRDNSAYFDIQGKLTAKFKEAEVTSDPSRPLVFMGHSLGCHILSSYCWDINRLKQIDDIELNGWNNAGATKFVRELREVPPFRKLDILAGIVTMGCNTPLFTFTFGPDRVFLFTHPPSPKMTPAFPGKGLTAAQKSKARWINFYGPNDLLGYLPKPLNSHYYDDARIQERIVRSEGFWRSWLAPSIFNTYKAHLGYWTNATVIREMAALVRQAIESDDIPMPKRTRPSEAVNH